MINTLILNLKSRYEDIYMEYSLDVDKLIKELEGDSEGPVMLHFGLTGNQWIMAKTYTLSIFIRMSQKIGIRLRTLTR